MSNSAPKTSKKSILFPKPAVCRSDIHSTSSTNNLTRSGISLYLRSSMDIVTQKRKSIQKEGNWSKINSFGAKRIRLEQKEGIWSKYNSFGAKSIRLGQKEGKWAENLGGWQATKPFDGGYLPGYNQAGGWKKSLNVPC